MSPGEPDGTELLLEPDGHPAVRPFKTALVEDGIAFTSFAVDVANAEFERPQAAGAPFTHEPVEMNGATMALLDDTCGNLIQIASQAGWRLLRTATMLAEAGDGASALLAAPERSGPERERDASP